MKGRILLVDDNVAMCDTMEDILRDKGFEPFSAYSCAEGVKLARQRQPQVALLDLKLPDGLGTELLASLKELDPDCVCIIATAFADVESALSALERGAYHYLHKPVRPAELLQILHRAFEMIRLREEKSRAAEALRKSEEKYRTLVDNLNAGIYRVSGTPQGAIYQANPAMAKIFGHDSVEEFMRLSILDLYKNPQERLQLLEELARNGSFRDRELQCVRKNGEPFWISCTATARYGEDGMIAWIDGVVEEITGRKMLEEQLRQSQKMEAIGTLAGGVAHDFNNILTAIIGFASLLQMQVETDDPLRRFVDGIMTSSEKAARLTRDLLAFSRRQFVDLKPIMVNETVAKVEWLLRRVIGEDIELRTILSAEGLSIMADGPQIEQVLLNIAINGRSAMPEGGVLTIETGRVELDAGFIKNLGHGEPGSYAQITLSDTGSGMDERTRERVFEPFFTTKEVGKGTGLGLSIAYGIIKQHNGHISVSSELGRGTTFTILLPTTGEVAELVRPPAVEEPRGGNETVLLAEDNVEVRGLEKDLLEAFGYTVIEAVDGEDAVRKFNGNREVVQLLIFDVIMPKKNGKEAYEEIRREKPGIKVIFASGYTGEFLSRRGICDDGVNFCAKPIMPKEFLQKVRTVLDR